MAIKTNVGKILIMPKGAWVDNVTYYNLDMVTHGGSKYLCKKETCIGIEPSSMTADTWYAWDDSDIGGSPVTFTTAVSRTDIASGDALSIIVGKIKKWLSDIKQVAFTGSFNDLVDVPTASSSVKGLAKVDGTTITADADGTLHGAATITIDDEMSATSTNPVQNKILNGVIGSLDDLETFSKTSIVSAVNEANHELLSTREAVEAVTVAGKGVDATVVKEINEDLVDYCISREIGLNPTTLLAVNQGIVSGTIPTISGYKPIMVSLANTGSHNVYMINCSFNASNNSCQIYLRNTASSNVEVTPTLNVIYIRN